jgi:hypothetical protein
MRHNCSNLQCPSGGGAVSERQCPGMLQTTAGVDRYSMLFLVAHLEGAQQEDL